MDEGHGSFQTTGVAYDGFMGRYSRPLADLLADATDLTDGADGLLALDVGCGPGALTGVLVRRLGAGAVSACDPSPPFVSECQRRCPGVTVRPGTAEAIPFEDDSFDRVLAQLVLHFVGEPAAAAREFRRVLRPGGLVSACVWDFDGGMEMLRLFWDAAVALDPVAPDEARTLRFGRVGEIALLFDDAGLEDVRETTLSVGSTYATFDELWSGFLDGIGPAGSYCLSLSDEHRAALRAEMFGRLGSPSGSFSLTATARCASAREPGSGTG